MKEESKQEAQATDDVELEKATPDEQETEQIEQNGDIKQDPQDEQEVQEPRQGTEFKKERSWRNPRDIALGVRRLQKTKTADRAAASFLGGSAISIEGSLILPEYDSSSDLDGADDISSVATSQIEGRLGGAPPTIVIDGFSIDPNTEDPPLPVAFDDISLNDLHNFNNYYDKNNNNNMSDRPKDSTISVSNPNPNNNNKSKKDVWEDDVSSSARENKIKPYLKTAFALGVALLMIGAAVAIIVYALSRNDDNAPSSALSPATSPPSSITTSSPTLPSTLSTIQKIPVPMEISFGNTPELNDQSLTTFERVTADYIQSELQNAPNDGDFLLVEVEVSVNVLDQELVDESTAIGVEFERANNVNEFNEIMGLAVYLETIVTFRSTTIVQDKYIVYNLVNDIFDTEDGQQKYLKELQSTDDETFRNTNEVQVKVDEGKDETPKTTSLPTSTPTKSQLLPTPFTPTSTPTFAAPSTQPPSAIPSSRPSTQPSISPTATSIGKGFSISNNESYEPTNVSEFVASDSIYMKIWWDIFDFNDVWKTEYEVKIDGWKYKGELINHYNGFFTAVWVGGREEPFGDGTVKLKIEDNKRKYEVKDVPIFRSAN